MNDFHNTGGESYDFGGIPLGIWSARMVVHQNIDSWVSIDGQQAYILYKGQQLSCKHCKEQTHTGISCVQNKKLLVQKSYANVTKQSGQRQPQQKSTGGTPPNTKPVDQRSTEPPAVTPNAFPELPKSTIQTEQSDRVNQTDDQSAKIDLTMSPNPHNQCAHGSSSASSLLAPPQVTAVELFKKPSAVSRSQSKSGNGYETDESSTSTNSRKSNKGRPPGKKRKNDGDSEQDDDQRL